MHGRTSVPRKVAIPLVAAGTAFGISGALGLASQHLGLYRGGGGCVGVACPAPGFTALPFVAGPIVGLLIAAAIVPLVMALRPRLWWVGVAVVGLVDGVMGVAVLAGIGPWGSAGPLGTGSPPYAIQAGVVTLAGILLVAGAVVSSLGLVWRRPGATSPGGSRASGGSTVA
jgi:hypothetical protein